MAANQSMRDMNIGKISWTPLLLEASRPSVPFSEDIRSTDGGIKTVEGKHPAASITIQVGRYLAQKYL